MRLKNIHGRLVWKNYGPYRVNWDGECRSKIQFEVKKFLQPYWENNYVCEEAPVIGTRLKVDIINFTKKIAVEVQGSQHEKFNKFFHNNSKLNFLNSIKRDQKKFNWLELNEIKLIEIKECEISLLTHQWIVDKFEIFL